MNPALQRTLELLLIIGIGLLLQRKLSGKQHLEGLKLIILNVALPATIFLALLRVELEASLLFLPGLALAFNVFMLLMTRGFLPLMHPGASAQRRRTWTLLLPSLAPGLSCFPFVMAYLDDAMVALAALADVGNKFFGLILLYLLAMHWYRRVAVRPDQGSSLGKKVKELCLALLREPINMVIVVAILLLVAGVSLDSLPGFVTATIGRFSTMMVALVLLFIGMAMRVSRSDLSTLLQLLSWRSGVAFLFSAVCLFAIPGLTPAFMLLLVVFPQSSCSFWPFSHMHVVSRLEKDSGRDPATFDLDHAVNVLACSLPFSSLLILLVFNFGTFFTDPWKVLFAGAGLTLLSLFSRLWKWLMARSRGEVAENALS